MPRKLSPELRNMLHEAEYGEFRSHPQGESTDSREVGSRTHTDLKPVDEIRSPGLVAATTRSQRVAERPIEQEQVMSRPIQVGGLVYAMKEKG